MLKITLAAAVLLGAASAAHATCTFVGGPLNGAVLNFPAPVAGVISGTFTSPPGINSATAYAGGFTLGNGADWEVATIDSDRGNHTDFDVVIIVKAPFTAYKAWGEELTVTPFHHMAPPVGAVTGAVGGHC
jgi:hypothetical protein